ncbi:uncharacterized protein LOC124775682 [Schistocerca piceifrons]|uniref:uncharacterized protein LOC124775682 n=1 Tax=Schistocerca piceifrons TaxID=274613 RepID=UPI001F5F2FDE|nr:uncharacterized protein LOC124775682 [Schistocerca piceifrons]
MPPFKQRGHLVESVYLPKTRLAITATTKGAVIIWTDAECSESSYSEERTTNAMELKKILQLEKHPITVLRAVDKVVVTGNTKGRISFYDHQLKILYWCHKFNLDSITGINFHLRSRYRHLKDQSVFDVGTSEHSHARISKGDDLDEQVLSRDATLQKNLFIIREFVVCTESGQVGLVNVMRNACEFLLDRSVGVISSMAVHPEKTHLCIGNSCGQLFLWNHRTKECLKSKRFTSDNMSIISAITALQYAPSGLFLACGLDNGSLWFLDTSVLAPLQESCQQHSTSKITQIIFSEDSRYLAHKVSGMTSVLCIHLLCKKGVRFLGFQDEPVEVSSPEVGDLYKLYVTSAQAQHQFELESKIGLKDCKATLSRPGEPVIYLNLSVIIGRALCSDIFGYGAHELVVSLDLIDKRRLKTVGYRLHAIGDIYIGHNILPMAAQHLLPQLSQVYVAAEAGAVVALRSFFCLNLSNKPSSCFDIPDDISSHHSGLILARASHLFVSIPKVTEGPPDIERIGKTKTISVRGDDYSSQCTVTFADKNVNSASYVVFVDIC